MSTIAIWRSVNESDSAKATYYNNSIIHNANGCTANCFFDNISNMCYFHGVNGNDGLDY